MSFMGTNIAASIAQTPLAAQQVARQRAVRDRGTSGDTRRVEELIEARMLALEEGDTGSSPTAPHIDQQLPQQQPPAAQQPPARRHPEADAVPPIPGESHLDVQA